MTPHVYVRRPLEVEAVQWKGYPGQTMEILEWVHVHGGFIGHYPKMPSGAARLKIVTREGPMWADVGDYIVREPFPTDDRRFYPVKAEVFEHGYDEKLHEAADRGPV